MNPREIAYLSLLRSIQKGVFISECLSDYRSKCLGGEKKDLALAQEIAYGSSRMALSLDFLAEKFTHKKLKLKLKEKILLRIALYQYYYMDKIPLYALTHESVQLAKKYCHIFFANFLNALLRNLGEKNPEYLLPHGDELEAMSVRYSFPLFFIKEIVDSYGFPQAKEILKTLNESPQVIARVRSGSLLKETNHLILEEPFKMILLNSGGDILPISKSSDFYIQNMTPAVLMAECCQRLQNPRSILDLCASPGGKSLIAHEFFPKAKLIANDISEEKILRLKENFEKYSVEAQITCSAGEVYESSELFDCIILDVPCSNTGVLHKRPEARWRLSEELVRNLETTQLKLLQNAKNLLSSEGVICYMTCSILKHENEFLVEKACNLFDLKKVGFEKLILPNKEGWDGGYCCLLKK